MLRAVAVFEDVGPEDVPPAELIRAVGIIDGPVEALIRSKRHLLIVPSGALTALPFHLLVTEPPAGTAPTCHFTTSSVTEGLVSLATLARRMLPVKAVVDGAVGEEGVVVVAPSA